MRMCVEVGALCSHDEQTANIYCRILDPKFALDCDQHALALASVYISARLLSIDIPLPFDEVYIFRVSSRGCFAVF